MWNIFFLKGSDSIWCHINLLKPYYNRLYSRFEDMSDYDRGQRLSFTKFIQITVQSFKQNNHYHHVEDSKNCPVGCSCSGEGCNWNNVFSLYRRQFYDSLTSKNTENNLFRVFSNFLPTPYHFRSFLFKIILRFLYFKNSILLLTKKRERIYLMVPKSIFSRI